MRILTIIYATDLPQLLLQAASLRQFWKGNRHWTIIIEPTVEGYEECRDFIVQRILPMFTCWQIDIISPSCDLEMGGWHRQQLFKLVYSAIEEEEEWVMVLDAKNFLIRPIDESFFVRGNTIRHLPLAVDNEFNRDTHNDSRKLLGITEEVPLGSPMTPWVWKSTDIRQLLDKTGISLKQWVNNKASEYMLYWNMFYSKYQWNPDMFATGFWGNDCPYEFAQSLVDNAKVDPTMKFWVHHRFAYDPVLRKMTVEILEHVGIDRRVLDEWETEYSLMFAKHHKVLMVDRIPLWPHIDKEQE